MSKMRAHFLDEGFRLANLSSDKLRGHRCTESQKVQLPELLWKKTKMSQAWIAKHLGIKNAPNASRILHHMDLSRIKKKGLATLRCFASEKMKENEP